ncbi:MAG: hypothetical protein ABI577_17245 [bacterium]
MTAKQALRERVDLLTEEEAEELLARLDWESSEFEELTSEESAELDSVLAGVATGDWSDGEELFRKLGV